MTVVVAELGEAPGKSMQAHEGVTSLEIDHLGLFGDREIMWVEAEPHKHVLYHPGTVAPEGQFISQREDPVALTGMKPILANGGILFNPLQDSLWVPRAEDIDTNRIPVSVFRWSGEAVDQGDDIARWGSERIGRPVRLVAVSNEKPRYVEGDPELGRVGFADGYPITVGSTATLDIINTYLASVGRPAMPANRLRANIILDGLSVEDPRAFPEDFVQSIRIACDGMELVLERRKACERCPIPDTDQTTGERKQHIRSALGKLGRTGTHRDTGRYGTEPGTFLNQNLIIRLPEGMEEGQVIAIERGAEVEVTYADTPNWVPKSA